MPSKFLKSILIIGATGGVAAAIAIPILLIDDNSKDNDKKLVEDVKGLFEKLEEKKKIITISATSGNINDNKEMIELKVKKLLPILSFPGIDKVKVIVSPNQNEEITLEGIPFQITIEKGVYITELGNEFIVKRSQTTQEINADITDVKKAIKGLVNKIITISATSGTITSNKAAILVGLKSLNGYNTLDLKGTTIAIKEAGTILTVAGAPFTIQISKAGRTTQEILTGFKVKRSSTIKEAKEDILEIKQILERIKDTHILISSTSGTIEQNKVEIFEKIRGIHTFPFGDVLKGTTIKVKDGQAIFLSDSKKNNVDIEISKTNGNTEIVTFSNVWISSPS